MELNKAILNLFCCLFVLVFVVSTGESFSVQTFSKERFHQLQSKLRECCVDSDDGEDAPSCAILKQTFLEELKMMKFRDGISFKYATKLWKSMSKVAEEVGERFPESTKHWMVNATKLELSEDGAWMLPRGRVSTRSKLTRIELVIPFYHLASPHCEGKHGKTDGPFITVNNDKIISQSGTVPHKNALVFRLPINSEIHNLTINVNSDNESTTTHMTHAIVVRYYNIKTFSLDKFTLHASKKKDPYAGIMPVINKMSDPYVGPQRTYLQRGLEEAKREIKSRRRRDTQSSSKSCGSCKPHDYVINMKDQVYFNDLFTNPDKINIKKCAGDCKTLDFNRADATLTTRAVFLNLMVKTGDQEPLKSSCVPDKMLSVSLMRFSADVGETIVMQVFLNGQIHSCRCV